jgi:hypothetical protein
VNVKGFKKCCISYEMNGTDNDKMWNGSEEDGNGKSWCEEVKALRMETVTLIRRDRI